jgi:ribose/xylose/arabinose/galactoside ABC-type transport system permease subunit
MQTKLVSNLRNIMPLLLLVIMLVFFSIYIPNFFAIQNFENISRQIAVYGILAAGMTLAILSGGIDLSVGSNLALSITIGGMAINAGWPIYIVYPLVLLVGGILGMINGFLITRLNISPLIVTLATVNIYRGIAIVISHGLFVTGIPKSYLVIGGGYMPLILYTAVYVIFIVLTVYTKFGRNIFAIGGNELAAVYSGVPVKRYKLYIYTIVGFTAGLAGLIFIGRSGFSAPQVGAGYEFNAIAAVVIGGTYILGGDGSIFRTFIGSILMSVLIVGLTMLGVDPNWQGAVTGGLILLAISLDSLRHYEWGQKKVGYNE